MRKMVVGGVVMAVAAVVLGVAYFGFGTEPGDLIQGVIDGLRLFLGYHDPYLWEGHRPIEVDP
jgi:hypothetical protein